MRLKETIEQAIFESCPEVEKETNVPLKNRWNISLKIKDSFRAALGILSKYSAFVQVEELKTDNKSSSLVIFKKVPFEDEHTFEIINTDGVSPELAKYTYEIVGRTLSKLNAVNNRC